MDKGSGCEQLIQPKSMFIIFRGTLSLNLAHDKDKHEIQNVDFENVPFKGGSNCNCAKRFSHAKVFR